MLLDGPSKTLKLLSMAAGGKGSQLRLHLGDAMSLTVVFSCRQDIEITTSASTHFGTT